MVITSIDLTILEIVESRWTYFDGEMNGIKLNEVPQKIHALRKRLKEDMNDADDD